MKPNRRQNQAFEEVATALPRRKVAGVHLRGAARGCFLRGESNMAYQPNRTWRANRIGLVLLRAVVDGTTCSSRCAHASSKTWMRKGRLVVHAICHRHRASSPSSRPSWLWATTGARVAVSGLVSRERRLHAHPRAVVDRHAFGNASPSTWCVTENCTKPSAVRRDERDKLQSAVVPALAVRLE